MSAPGQDRSLPWGRLFERAGARVRQDGGQAILEYGDQILVRAAGQVVSVWSACVAGEPRPVGVRWLTSTGTDIVVYCYDDTFLVAAPDGLELDDVTYSEIC
ncbi:MAG TPA: hypothetical protein VJU80_18370 [Solirubrobacteraceae bacterium]|nr:hypothetical protein [Solirubrobacteraceae bacterium]